MNKPTYDLFTTSAKPAAVNIHGMVIARDSLGRHWGSLVVVTNKIAGDGYVETSHARYRIVRTEKLPPVFNEPNATRFFAPLVDITHLNFESGEQLSGLDSNTGDRTNFAVDSETKDWYDGQFRSGIRRGQYGVVLK